jgi:oxidase EvaA
MSVEEIPLDAAAPWGVFDGRVGREDGKFFSIIAIMITGAAREVKKWPQLIVKEAAKPGEEGVVVLAHDGCGNYLVQAKAEPGNDTEGCVLLAASLQVSRANLVQVHGGARPPRAELLDDIDLDRATVMRADGARFWHKRNLYVPVRVDFRQLFLSENERWFSEAEMREALATGDINEHLAHAWLVVSKT